MTICWFGIYKPEESRNRIYMRGLKQLGVNIIECQDSKRGFLKFFNLFLKHRKLRNSYDYMIIGYPGHVVVPFARLISRKPVILDALCSLYEGVIISREQHGLFFLKEKYIRMVDRLAMRFSDLILVESESQKKFLEEKLGCPLGKCHVVYTGADDGQFFIDTDIKKKDRFTAVFRGKFLPEAGISHILEAAKILEDKEVDFLIMGYGWLEKQIKLQIQNLKLTNLQLIDDYLSEKEMRENMLSCHVSLGQFESHERLERTIPHKCYESLALGLPYITARTQGVMEILEDGKECLFVNPADSKDLADKILYLKNNPDIMAEIGQNGFELYKEKFTPKALASRIMNLLK